MGLPGPARGIVRLSSGRCRGANDYPLCSCVRDPDGLHTFRTDRTRPRTACDHEACSLDNNRR